MRDLKTKISSQSKKNFVLERDVRYLDSRIALLIQNVRTRRQCTLVVLVDLRGVQRMALDEREEMKEHMEEVDETTGDKLDDRRMQVRYYRTS